MKTLFTAEATFESGRLKTNQTSDGPDKAKLSDREAGRPFLAMYRRPVQFDLGSMPGCDESDLMKSQLG
ncbi:MAG TPA: hypothetical protein VMR33_21560 [Candidatus Baltobacteraceae bacterium]|jgi:hypothetical protein|nr:hypothetical protein [Candidatus Baltobacteraceae bacterium]